MAECVSTLVCCVRECACMCVCVLCVYVSLWTRAHVQALKSRVAKWTAGLSFSLNLSLVSLWSISVSCLYGLPRSLYLWYPLSVLLLLPDLSGILSLRYLSGLSLVA